MTNDAEATPTATPPPPPPPLPDARAVALRILARWLESGTFPDRLVESVDGRRGFIMEVVYGVARWRRTLEWMLAPAVRRPPAPAVQAALLAGAYQLLHMDTVPPFAAIHATVEAVKAAGHGPAAGFVNAVLRGLQRRRAERDRALARQPVAIRESHPDLLVARWTAQFGAQRTAALCAWNNCRPDVVLHVNPARTSAADYLARLREAGIAAEPHPAAPEACLTLAHGVRVPELPGFAEGLFSIQDPSTLAAVRLLDPRPGESVLDACAAPGGKTMLIAHRMGGSGRLVAVDNRPDRVARLRANLARLALDWVTVRPADIARGGLKEVEPEGFDAVLLDVPCTNTGVLRRRPDARWRFTAEVLGSVTAIQRRLLDAAAESVKPGGRLVYSTCSLEPEEDEAQIAAWCAAHPAFKAGADVKLVPPGSATDGAYAACLHREG